MKSAVIIGGNQGGLNMARCLVEAGFSVRLFDKKKFEDLAYDWTDDIAPSVFEEIGIAMPPKDAYYSKKVWTFVNPSENVKITVEGGAQDNDISIYRRPLNRYLRSLVEGKAELNYETAVESLILDGNKVKGVKVGGKDILCDLVVDCSGVYSPFRASLPDSACMTKQPRENEVFVAYRGFFRPKAGAAEPTQTNKAYLLHTGRAGISWCIYDNNMVDILVGSIGKLEDKDLTTAIAALKKDNPILSDELIKAGFKAVIPVRYPASRLVADGYVLCGDSAFMTIPMMGSGIVCSLHCGAYLRDVLKKNDDCSIDNLWNYQVAFFKKYASFCAVDQLKRWLLSVNADDLDFLFESGVLDEGLLAGGAGGELAKMSAGQMLKKGWQGRKKIGLLLAISKVMSNAEKAEKIARKLPEKFDEVAVKAWQCKLDSLY